MNVLMEHGVINPTPDEIRVLQTLAPGWEEVWEKIALGLLGYNGKGRLSDAVGWLRGWTSEEEKKDFVAFVMCEFHEKVIKGNLIPNFDPEHPKSDVYDYICNWTIIRQAYKRFKGYGNKKKMLFEKTTSLNSEDEYGEMYDTQVISRYRTTSKTICDNLELLCSRLCEEKLTPQLPEKGKFDKVHEHAGLQLYPRLDNTVKRVSQLIDHVCDAVRKTNAMHTKPSQTIMFEHQEAQERVREQKKRYWGKIYKITDDGPKPSGIQTQKRYEIDRKLAATELESYFFPLVAKQTMRLLGQSRANADQCHKRYRERLSELMPSTLHEQAGNLLQELDEERQQREHDERKSLNGIRRKPRKGQK